ncbi:MAG: NUDIX domain-containing protein [Bacteroidia bacterium]
MTSQAKKSAGILLFWLDKKEIKLFLVHPGGPFWAKKDEGSWSIPKGEFTENEEPLIAAKREFFEETGFEPNGDFIQLGTIKQKGGKLVYAWAVAGYFNADEIKSNSFEMEWPPGSGKRQQFPEVDRAGWFTTNEAKRKIIPAQIYFIEELLKIIKA